MPSYNTYDILKYNKMFKIKVIGLKHILYVRCKLYVRGATYWKCEGQFAGLSCSTPYKVAGKQRNSLDNFNAYPQYPYHIKSKTVEYILL